MPTHIPGRGQAVTVHDILEPLAKLLWRQYTVYRERGGTLVIRGEQAERWLSLTAHGSGRVRIRAGRILDGGTTAPARAETTAPLDGDIARLAACCRGLLAETADAVGGARSGGAGASSPVPRGPQRRPRKGWRGAVALGLICSAVAAGLVAALGRG